MGDRKKVRPAKREKQCELEVWVQQTCRKRARRVGIRPKGIREDELEHPVRGRERRSAGLG